MKRTTLVGAVAASAVGGLGAVAAGVGAQTSSVEAATAVLHVPEGGAIGRVNMTALDGGGVLVRATIRKGAVAPGFHGFHVHAVGACDPAARNAAGAPAPYDSAKGHLNPAGGTHGAHAGDLPTLLVTSTSRAVLETVTDSLTLADVLDADGAALIVHAGRDNQANIPPRYSSPAGPGPDSDTLATGDSGGRIACGAVRAVDD